MARITSTREQIHAATLQCQQQCQQMVLRLTNTTNGLHSEWEDLTAMRFAGDFEQKGEQMTHFVQLLNRIGQQLHSVAVLFESANTSG